jgi:hypothetical protein
VRCARSPIPALRDLAGVDFAQTRVDEALVRRLHTLEFLDTRAQRGADRRSRYCKTHLITALGIEAIQQQGKCVRFFTTVELVNNLEQEKAAGKAGQLAYRLLYVDLVILDELGYLPFS